MVWSNWHKNPFMAIKEIASPEHYQRVLVIYSGAPLWSELEADMLVADVLDDIADELSIVVKDRLVGDGEQRSEEYAACYVTETN